MRRLAAAILGRALRDLRADAPHLFDGALALASVEACIAEEA